MNPSLQLVLDEIRSPDIRTARNAVVRARLVLEHDVRGYWDSVIEGFPQPGLYDQVFTDADIAEVIGELAILSQDSSVPHELRESTISALCASNRLETFTFFVRLLNESEDFRTLCETTDVLLSIAFFRDDQEFFRQRAAELRGIVDKLKGIEFTDETARIAKQRLLAHLDA